MPLVWFGKSPTSVQQRAMAGTVASPSYTLTVQTGIHLGCQSLATDQSRWLGSTNNKGSSVLFQGLAPRNTTKQLLNLLCSGGLNGHCLMAKLSILVAIVGKFPNASTLCCVVRSLLTQVCCRNNLNIHSDQHPNKTATPLHQHGRPKTPTTNYQSPQHDNGGSIACLGSNKLTHQ